MLTWSRSQPLMKIMRGIWRSRAWFQARMVPGPMPDMASMTRIIMSHMLMAFMASPQKSVFPGVSAKKKWPSFHGQWRMPV